MSTYPLTAEERLERFMGRIMFEPMSGCWLWTGTVERYGILWFNGGTRLAHRVSYELFVGPIPAGMVIDHIVCDNPPCVNPWHLRVTDTKTNVTRGRAPTAVASRTNICVAGLHPLEGNNLIRRADGYRSCRECHRAVWRNYTHRHRERLAVARRQRALIAKGGA